jgi:hypothetical protein
MAKPTPIDPLAPRDVADYEMHSGEGIRALISILASNFGSVKPREIIDGVLDRLERLEMTKPISPEVASSLDDGVDRSNSVVLFQRCSGFMFTEALNWCVTPARKICR